MSQMMTDRRDLDTPLSTRDVASMFGVTMKTIHRWAESGRLPSFKTLGGQHRFYPSAIEEVLAARASEERRNH
jgi:excisionase family DNA binding protein